jgi:fumarate hydratase class I
MYSKEEIVKLYRRTATEIPEDIERGLKNAISKETGISRDILKTILENIDLARKEGKPICQDTGVPIFYVKCKGPDQERIRKIILEATKYATSEILRPNALDPLTGKSMGNVPIIHFEESDKFGISLFLKGGGSENITKVYSLPNKELKANRDFEGVEKCVLDSVFRAQGKGCPPYVVGVGIGGTVEETIHLAKKQLLRDIYDRNENKELDKLERKLLKKINGLGIGPLGLGGKTTALGVKISSTFRHPASYFVCVSFACWCLRRRKL